MGQQANNRGRRATLDNKKVRAAGREKQQVERQIRDAVGGNEEAFARAKTAGATSPRTRGVAASASAASKTQSVRRSTRPARKR